MSTIQPTVPRPDLAGEAPRRRRTGIGTDGTPYTVETNHIYLGLISADDYLNGIPNYTEVGEYTA